MYKVGQHVRRKSIGVLYLVSTGALPMDRMDHQIMSRIG